MSDPIIDNTQAPEPRPFEFGAGTRQPSLDELHVAFARELSSVASQHLRGDLEIAFGFAERMRYDEFLHSLGDSCCLGVLRVDPPGADVCLDIGLGVVYPMIDRLLGGPGDASPPAPHRPLTQIEQGLALQIIERAAAVLSQTWGRPGAAVSVREQSLACSSPADVRIMPGDEMICVARFDMRFGPAAGGTLSLCVPAPVERYLGEIPPPMRSPAERDADRADLQSHLLKSALELRALLAETKLRLSDVLNMQPGDVITTDKRIDDEVPVLVQGRERFAGRLGQFRGARAVEITRAPDDPKTGGRI